MLPSHMQAPTKLTGVDAAKFCPKVGGLLALLSIAMLLPFAVAVANSEKEQWILTLAVIGGSRYRVVSTKTGDAKLRARQVFLLTSLCWLSASHSRHCHLFSATLLELRRCLVRINVRHHHDRGYGDCWA